MSGRAGGADSISGSRRAPWVQRLLQALVRALQQAAAQLALQQQASQAGKLLAGDTRAVRCVQRSPLPAVPALRQGRASLGSGPFRAGGAASAFACACE